MPIAFALLASLPQVAQLPPPPPRPSYKFLRHVEDWSVLARIGPPAERDFYDAAKYIPLNSSGSVWLSSGARAETRVESWRSFAFGAPPGVSHDDVFVVSRVLAHADLHLGPNVRVFTELKTAQATERDLPGGRRTLDMDTFEAQELFLDATSPLGASSSATLRLGRQMLLLGAQRLVSPLPWGNTLRTWDGATLLVSDGPLTVTGIATAFVPVDKTEPNEVDRDVTLYGVYATLSTRANDGADLYWLVNERPNVTVNGTSGDELRHTLGARLWSVVGADLDYELEGAWQFGEVGSENVSAGFLASQLGWRPADLAWTPRLWLGLDLASGDGKAGGSVGTFHQLFPLGHAYFGAIDTIGRQNIVDASFGAAANPSQRWKLRLENHAFWAMDNADALYNAGGVPFRAGGSYDSRSVGFELDLLAEFRFDRHLDGYLGFSHFFSGDAIEESGPSEDIDFAYLGLRYTI